MIFFLTNIFDDVILYEYAAQWGHKYAYRASPKLASNDKRRIPKCTQLLQQEASSTR